MAKLKWWRPVVLKWNNTLKVAKPNPKAQKALERIACKMRRVAKRHGIYYVSIFTFADGTVDITAKDVDNNYIVEEYATWQK